MGVTINTVSEALSFNSIVFVNLMCGLRQIEQPKECGA